MTKNPSGFPVTSFQNRITSIARPQIRVLDRIGRRSNASRHRSPPPTARIGKSDITTHGCPNQPPSPAQ
jgi:hypothetical protein